jgi:hypothetical protein
MKNVKDELLLLDLSHRMLNNLPLQRSHIVALVNVVLKRDEQIRILRAKYKKLKIKYDGLDNE